MKILAPAGQQDVSENVTAAEPTACATPDWDRPISPNQILGAPSLACSRSLVQGVDQRVVFEQVGGVSGGGSVDRENRGWPSISHLLALACSSTPLAGVGGFPA